MISDSIFNFIISHPIPLALCRKRWNVRSFADLPVCSERGEEELRGEDEGAPEDEGDLSLIYEDAE